MIDISAAVSTTDCITLRLVLTVIDISAVVSIADCFTLRLVLTVIDKYQLL